MTTKLLKNTDNLREIEEHEKLLKLLRRYITIIDVLVAEKQYCKQDSYDGVCYMFAKSILNYSKSCVDNLVLGHFHSFCMITRTIIENYVCFDIIYKHPKEELWKY